MRSTLCPVFLFAVSGWFIAGASPAVGVPIAAANSCAPTPRECLDLALLAMGGRERLAGINQIAIDVTMHTALVEQSYRQDPFITAYARSKQKLDFAGQRMLAQTHSIWPESDQGQFESDATLVVGTAGGVSRGDKSDTPAQRADVDDAHQALALGPLRALLTASQAADLRFEAAQPLRSTPHPVLAFTHEGTPVRLLINPYNHLPDAVETTTVFNDHWYQWGDVRRRINFDNWQVFHGIVYPTNEVEERNGIFWQSRQVLSLDLNPAIDAADFKMDDAVAAKVMASRGWESPFKAATAVALAAGITLFPGAWNATLVKQDDGIVLLEAPLSETYIGGVIDKARAENPGLAVKSVLSTSDSWPHVGGIRYVVAEGLPVYILDLNKPLLERLTASPRRAHPDLLAKAPRQPHWRLVSAKIQVGSGVNRMELYPLRGAATERQYMVYFPEHRLLYASDTLALNSDGSLYDPELMREVVAAVKRENLSVTTVFAMHEGPLPWSQVTALVDKALT